MNRSARFAVRVAAVAPLATALAVTAAPAHAAPMNAGPGVPGVPDVPGVPLQAPHAGGAPGPATALLYETAAAADPVTRTLPGDVVRTAGRTAEAGTGAVDGALGAAAPGARRAEPPLSIASPSGLPDVSALLSSSGPEALRLGSLLFPSAARRTGPVPAGDLVGQVTGTARGAGGLVPGLPNKDRPAKPADGPPPLPLSLPLSMPHAPGLGLPELPGTG